MLVYIVSWISFSCPCVYSLKSDKDCAGILVLFNITLITVSKTLLALFFSIQFKTFWVDGCHIKECHIFMTCPVNKCLLATYTLIGTAQARSETARAHFEIELAMCTIDKLSRMLEIYKLSRDMLLPNILKDYLCLLVFRISAGSEDCTTCVYCSLILTLNSNWIHSKHLMLIFSEV